MSLAQSWRERSPAERRTYATLGAIVAMVLLATFVWIPLERAHTRLAADLPRLRGSVAGMERDAQEVKRLRALPSPPARADSPLASLATDGGGLPGAQITVVDPRRVRVSGSDVGFAALLEWQRAAQATHGMRVESARLEALPAAGRVRAELMLARS